MPRSPLPRALAETRTHDHLRTSSLRDAQAARLWARFARIADFEGLPAIGSLFRDLAECDGIAADGHLDLLARAGDPLVGAPMGDTRAHLETALELVRGEVTGTLADMARTARAEGFLDVASWFETLARARSAQAERLARALVGPEAE